MINLTSYNVRPGRVNGEEAVTPGGVPQIYQIEGLSLEGTTGWNPLEETVYDERIAIPFTTRATNPNGVKIEQLLAIMIHRLESFQTGKHASPYNQTAIVHLRSALDTMERRMIAVQS